MSKIVENARFMTLLGAELPHSDSLEMALARSDAVVAADGGALHALARGIVPDAVIGDFDSLPPETCASLPPDRLHHVAEQDTTDFEKCLDRVSAEAIFAFGFTGGRSDHTLAAFNAVATRPASRCLLIDAHDLVFLAPRKLELDLPAGTRVSLFPMGEVEGESEGLRWPIGGIRFRPGGRIGTSNMAEGGRVRLGFSAPRMLVMLPPEALDAALEGLGLGGAWRARKGS